MARERANIWGVKDEGGAFVVSDLVRYLRGNKSDGTLVG